MDNLNEETAVDIEDVDLTETEEEVEQVEELEEAETEEEVETIETEEEPEAEEDAEDEAEVIVSIDGETPPQEEEEERAPKWVRELRKSHREMQKENRELKKKLETVVEPEKKPVELPKKPTLEECDYDTEAYDNKLTSWFETKREYEQQQAEAKAEQDRQAQEWQEKLNAYEEKKKQLKVRDYEYAEEFVVENFDQTQQGVMINGADDPALLVYALGKNHNKAKELSQIKDPVKFAFAVAKLETKLKVSNRKAKTSPEKTISGKAPKSGTADSNLERLRKEAEKTGDYSKVMRYKLQLRNQQR